MFGVSIRASSIPSPLLKDWYRFPIFPIPSRISRTELIADVLPKPDGASISRAMFGRVPSASMTFRPISQEISIIPATAPARSSAWNALFAWNLAKVSTNPGNIISLVETESLRDSSVFSCCVVRTCSSSSRVSTPLKSFLPGLSGLL